MRSKVLAGLLLAPIFWIASGDHVARAEQSGWFSVSAEVTKATASADWLTGDFSGSAQGWQACPESHVDIFDPDMTPLPRESSYCAWTPFASIGPGTGADDCAEPSREDPTAPGTEVEVIWTGDEHLGSAEDSFDLAQIALGGVPRPLLCISARLVEYESAQCWVSQSTGAVTCPIEERLSKRTISLLSVPISVEVGQSPAPELEAPGEFERPVAGLGEIVAEWPAAQSVPTEKTTKGKRPKRKPGKTARAGRLRVSGNTVAPGAPTLR